MRLYLVLHHSALLSAIAAAAPVPRTVIVSAAPFIAEGVAAGADGKPLVSAVAGRTIVRLDARRVKAWLRPGRLAPVGGLFGMAADPKRNRLWVAEVFGKAAPGQTGPNRSSILEVELSSGRALARHPAPTGDDDAPTLGDVAIAADGSVYASDSTGGGIYHLPPGGGALRRFARTGLRSPQG
jgi:streptogramin lyase